MVKPYGKGKYIFDSGKILRKKNYLAPEHRFVLLKISWQEQPASEGQ